MFAGSGSSIGSGETSGLVVRARTLSALCSCEVGNAIGLSWWWVVGVGEISSGS